MKIVLKKTALVLLLIAISCSNSSEIPIEQKEPSDTVNEMAKILIFYKTNGFVHESINDGIKMIRDLGETNGLWDTDISDDSAVFTSDNLVKYKTVIWLNTTGDNLLTRVQQEAFEGFISGGKGFVGIHSATDTYRDGSWPWYNNLVGAIVQINPYHTSEDLEGMMKITSSHPSVDFLGESWIKIDEYYYWELNGGFLYSGNQVILEVEPTGNESYDATRPISWYKEFGGGRSFYTALGHNTIDYREDMDFRKHIEEAVKWAMN